MYIFLQFIDNDYHPPMDLIRKCIDNHPQVRVHSSEMIVEQLTKIVLQFPPPFDNQLEMLMHIEADKEKRDLREEGERRNGVIQKKEMLISSLKEEVQAKERQKCWGYNKTYYGKYRRN